MSSAPDYLTTPFSATSGPHDAKIVIVGEAWGQQEDLVKAPFIGYSGQELTRMLAEAGIARKDCLLTNVFPLRPRDNKIEELCGKKADVGPGYSAKPLSQGKYILPQYLPALDRLAIEISSAPRTLAIALGNTACWALLGTAKIGQIRGTVAESSLVRGVKVLPTYHPAAILRNWANRPIVVADLIKAKRQSEYPEIRRPKRSILVAPTLDEAWEWARRPAIQYACDIETSHQQITCIGFARSRSDAMVIPFTQPLSKSNNFWPTIEDELEIRKVVQHILGGPVPKIGQNFLYDMQYLRREGYRLRNVQEDTMLMHHSLFPEMQKGLGFLGSIYTEEASWKLMRTEETTKRDE